MSTAFSTFTLQSFGALVVLAIILQVSTWQKQEFSTTDRFRRFQREYLVVALLAVFADWLQGPYVYMLYASYGFSKEEIGHLFIAGFGSSAFFGTIVGGLADKYGRRRFALLFAGFYAASCLTKLSTSYWMLMLGRVLGGVATSLLFSAFESWMVSEHHSRGYATSWLSQTFAYYTLGNGVGAIGAGLVASYVADLYGYVAPFMVALGILVVVGVLVSQWWDAENYGDSSIEVSTGFFNALDAFRADTRIILLGSVQSLFEASMYLFVFMWTPAIEAAVADGEHLEHGLIFACFMVAMMCGSAAFAWLSNKVSLEQLALGNLLLSSIALGFVAYDSDNPRTMLWAFFAFEFCVGLYFPLQGTLRSRYVPEATRSAIMNLFRVPLNLAVCLVLVQVGSLSNTFVFSTAAVWTAVGAVAQGVIVLRRYEPSLVDLASKAAPTDASSGAQRSLHAT
jgi:MFS family permease